jgi:predicted  nucleic acid-binding Zn-ribbon protein
MIEEKYLQMAISIRRTYLKLVNNMDLYRARALQVSERLEDTLKKLEKIKAEADDRNRNTKVSDQDLLNKLLGVIDDVEEEGKRLENLVEPINKEIEKLSREETELYRQIVDNHPSLSEDQIVKFVQDRLIKEGLS